MQLNERRLTGRDVLAKTFQAKTKRGYDPIEVDAYLELVAAQIDVLHSDINTSAQTSATERTTLDNPSVSEERDQLVAELASVRAERDSLTQAVAQMQATHGALTAENEQLRTQLTSIAPPPPLAAQPELAPVEVIEPVTEPIADAGSQSRGSEESYELVLRMAHRSAEETINEAHARADEIVADANLTASQIARESDRKAYEAANKVQAELASLAAEVETRQGELAHLTSQTTEQRAELRGMAQRILRLADEEPRRLEGAEVVDLRAQPSETTA